MQNTVKYALQCIQNMDYSGKYAWPSVSDDETKHSVSTTTTTATAQGTEKLQEGGSLCPLRAVRHCEKQRKHFACIK